MSAILKFIRDNHILAVIEKAIATKRSRLSLNSMEIAEIPSLVYSCFDVEHLYLHVNRITTIPVQITQLLNLTTLTLDYNNINALPAEIGNLKNLVNLNISYNPLGVLIPEIGDLENLEAFWCNKIGLKEIPKEIGKLAKLDTFGARGNELKSIPEEMTRLNKLRWLTLEHNEIDTLPDTMDNFEALVHCNLRHNKINDFPMSVLKCADLMFLQLSNNQITSIPEDFNTNACPAMEMIDLRDNPISELAKIEHPLIRYSEEQPQPDASLVSLRNQAAQILAINATALRLPAVPNHRHVRPEPAAAVLDIDLDASSIESSEDWENSVNSSDLDVQYRSDDDQVDNEAVLVLPELSRYASTAS